MSTANITSHVVVFEDSSTSSNPVLRHCDWTRTATGVSFGQVFSDRSLLAPGQTKVYVADSSADLSGETVSLAAVTGKPTWYAIEGAEPTSTWAASLGVPLSDVDVTVQTDGSILLTGSGLGSLAAVGVGDWIYLDGADYDGTGDFDSANQGFWSVIGVLTGVGLKLERVYDDGDGLTETVTVDAAWDIQHIPASTRPTTVMLRGLQIFAGLKSVVAVSHDKLFIATEPQFMQLASATFATYTTTPTYLSFVRIEANKEVVVVVGDASDVPNSVSLLPLSTTIPAWYESTGFATSISITNYDTETATVNVIYATNE